MTIRFTPAEDYEGLLKQARSLHTLAENNEEIRSIQAELINDLKAKLALRSDEEIDALRDTNEKLTEQVEILEGKVFGLTEELSFLTRGG